MVFLPQSGGTHELSVDTLIDLFVSLHSELSGLKGKGDLLADFTERGTDSLSLIQPRKAKQKLKSNADNIIQRDLMLRSFCRLAQMRPSLIPSRSWGGEPMERFVHFYIFFFFSGSVPSKHPQISSQVRLVKHKETNKVYAMKLMTKSKMSGNKEAAYFREERDVMALSESPWITTLHFAFQDTQYIYLVMEYNQGGNLLTQLYKDNVFDEPTAQFYLAETVLAVHAIHELGYLHRDVKPENLMLDPKGHIKITDFGTCIRMNAKGEVVLLNSKGKHLF